MLLTISRFLRGADSLTLSLSRTASADLRVLIQPKLGPEPDGLCDEAKQARAALAKPLLVTVSEEELDQTFSDLLCRAADARDSVSAVVEGYLSDMEEQKKAAEKKAADKRATTKTKGTKSPDTAIPKAPALAAPEPQKPVPDAAQAASPTASAPTPAPAPAASGADVELF